ncbi:hypothetical protein H671_7g17891 [Cricetulus griseus]|nr:hypothetical protein H671_7g17891 [Cricetulus griseus]
MRRGQGLPNNLLDNLVTLFGKHSMETVFSIIKTLLRLLVELVQELKKFHTGDKRLQLLGESDFALGGREATDYGADPEEQRVEIVPRDLRMKDKFLKHLTGPLYFSPKCSKHFHRLYHNTRDCTIPAYYKRCARLLTRLAVSPMCMER